MADYFIELPTIGEVLRVEFMEPLGVSSYKLAKEINVPVSRIQEILKDRRKITADTSLRLAKYFGVAERYFLDIQNDIELRKLKETMADEIDKIQPIRDEMTTAQFDEKMETGLHQAENDEAYGVEDAFDKLEK